MWSRTQATRGARLRRPGVQRALAALDAGEADCLLEAKLDRLSRSVLDVAGLLERARRRGWALVALDAPVDTSTAVGEAAANMVATWAQFERRRNGERTAEGIARWRQRNPRRTWGEPPAVPPDVVRKIKRRRAAGWSLARIAGKLNEEGIPTAHGGRQWWPSTVRAVLRRTA
jgi:DNA invertase Pin-like site-specific DNA recombinase